MKLLLDQNLSHRLVKSLLDKYPESNQVALLNMGNATDQAIWEYAKDYGFVIVTKDMDFYEFSMLLNGPPLVIWLRCGNQPKSVILERLLTHYDEIEAAFNNPDVWCVEIH